MHFNNTRAHSVFFLLVSFRIRVIPAMPDELPVAVHCLPSTYINLVIAMRSLGNDDAFVCPHPCLMVLNEDALSEIQLGKR